MFPKGKLYAIEGIDGVGKNTQSLLLVEHLKRINGDCGFFSFPRYDTPTGQEIAKYLNGEKPNLSLFERSFLYTKDRIATRSEIIFYLNSGVDVVCDRYIYSNIAYFTAIGKAEGMTKSENYIRDTILDHEFIIGSLPSIERMVVLDVSPELSQELILRKMKRSYTDLKKDLHEQQKNIQMDALDYYRRNHADEIVMCESNGDILPPEVIHQLVLEKLHLK